MKITETHCSTACLLVYAADLKIVGNASLRRADCHAAPIPTLLAAQAQIEIQRGLAQPDIALHHLSRRYLSQHSADDLRSSLDCSRAKALRYRRASRLRSLPPIKPMSSTARLTPRLDKSWGNVACHQRLDPMRYDTESYAQLESAPSSSGGSSG